MKCQIVLDNLMKAGVLHKKNILFVSRLREMMWSMFDTAFQRCGL